ncbi:glycosyl transferase [Nocardioides gansuensis]|uniref:Glycosyl transferase n=1 Tax=Nocardioides gansuensis TaxID=2138300 RepID=A0A2T8F6D1_9ACTN|nr:glycosyltransferase [Nocardioides gansuensis]PVG81272.1 glycosyl transferase [Nocardioides gansuensis]
MRIAQLANFIGPASGGMKTAVHALGEGYAGAGCERLLVIPGPNDARTSTPMGDVVQLRAPRVGGGYRLIVEPWRVIEVLEDWRPTSVELSDKLTLLPVARWARRNGVGSVLFSHERLDDMFTMRTGLETMPKVSIALLNRILVRSFDTVVVTSRYAQREFQKVADSAGCPMVRVPLGVDLETFRPHPTTPSDVLRLTHFGRLSREKSPHLAVAAAVELHRRGVPVQLDVYGEGPHLHELVELAGSAPVTFHGFVDGREDLNRRVAAADVSLSVCPGETFGLAVLEALASGTPVVTADRGGARELVDEASGAWGSPHPAALADAVLHVAARSVGARRAAARTRAEQFPWSATVESMLGVHERVRRTARVA